MAQQAETREFVPDAERLFVAVRRECPNIDPDDLAAALVVAWRELARQIAEVSMCGPLVFREFPTGA